MPKTSIIILNKIVHKIMNKTNPYFASNRRKMLKDTDFTIISNNCWAGSVYRYYGLPYNSPTVGLYFFPEDYLKFVANLKKYVNTSIRFIPLEESGHKDILIKKGQETVSIGVIDDIEVIFLHYHTQKEAVNSWDRRKKRIVWDNIIYKFSEMNGCTPEHLRKFDKLQLGG